MRLPNDFLCAKIFPFISFNNRQITLWANIYKIMNLLILKSKLSLEMEKNVHRRVSMKLFDKKYVDKFIDSYSYSYSYRKPLKLLNIQYESMNRVRLFLDKITS